MVRIRTIYLVASITLATVLFNPAQAQDADPGVMANLVIQVQELQDEAFFAGIRESVRVRLYHHPKLWEHINYPGSSKEHGGYIRRGFNDIAWLPEDK